MSSRRPCLPQCVLRLTDSLGQTCLPCDIGEVEVATSVLLVICISIFSHAGTTMVSLLFFFCDWGWDAAHSFGCTRLPHWEKIEKLQQI